MEEQSTDDAEGGTAEAAGGVREAVVAARLARGRAVVAAAAVACGTFSVLAGGLERDDDDDVVLVGRGVAAMRAAVSGAAGASGAAAAASFWRFRRRGNVCRRGGAVAPPSVVPPCGGLAARGSNDGDALEVDAAGAVLLRAAFLCLSQQGAVGRRNGGSALATRAGITPGWLASKRDTSTASSTTSLSVRLTGAVVAAVLAVVVLAVPAGAFSFAVATESKSSASDLMADGGECRSDGDLATAFFSSNGSGVSSSSKRIHSGWSSDLGWPGVVSAIAVLIVVLIVVVVIVEEDDEEEVVGTVLGVAPPLSRLIGVHGNCIHDVVWGGVPVIDGGLGLGLRLRLQLWRSPTLSSP